MSETTMPKTQTNGHTGTIDDDGPGLDEIHEILKEGRRRWLLRTLYEIGAREKKELARYVAAIEYGHERPGDVAEAEQKRVEVSLHQSHLPLLSKHGIVVWDRSTNQVSLGQYANRALRYIDGCDVDDDDAATRSFADRVAATVPSIF